LGGDLPKIYEKLISILRSISLANTRSKVSLEILNCWGCNVNYLDSSQHQKSNSFNPKQKRLTHKELMEDS